MSQQSSNFGNPYSEVGTPDPSKKPLTVEEHVGENAHQMGSVIPYANVSPTCVSGNRGIVGQGNFLAAADHTHNIKVGAVLGTPTDAMFTDPIDGAIVVDALPRKLFVRISGAWRWVQLT